MCKKILKFLFFSQFVLMFLTSDAADLCEINTLDAHSGECYGEFPFACGKYFCSKSKQTCDNYRNYNSYRTRLLISPVLQRALKISKTESRILKCKRAPSIAINNKPSLIL